MPAAIRKPLPMHRSGAVARMLNMPVATLRVWERRYALTDAQPSPGGQRLYAAADVQRLALIKQLTERGHAIGQLAPLALADLQRVAATHVQAQATAQPVPTDTPAPRTWRLAVVGATLGERLRRPDLLRQLGRPLRLLGPFDTVAQAAAALGKGPPPDAWLVQQPELPADWLAGFRAAVAVRGRPARKAPPAAVAVLFAYAAETTCDALAADGVALLREPQPDAALAQWLRLWAAAPAPSATRPTPAPTPSRRWADDDLTRFAAQSTTVACECPRHVAELLLQLSRFEAYSARCAQRSRADADLHAHLGQVAAGARARFEGALERVALHEGLLLPPPAV